MKFCTGICVKKVVGLYHLYIPKYIFLMIHCRIYVFHTQLQTMHDALQSTYIYGHVTYALSKHFVIRSTLGQKSLQYPSFS